MISFALRSVRSDGDRIWRGFPYLHRTASESDLLQEIDRDTGIIPQKHRRPLDRWRRLLNHDFSGKTVRFNEPIFVGPADLKSKEDGWPSSGYT